MARNCHKAVYHAVYLMELKTAYLYPEQTDFGIQGSISPEQVRDMLEQYPDTEAVLLTSPTYDGVVSDIAAIAALAHEKGVPLIVDEAHGAHFGFSQGFPQKALAFGADLCIESVHQNAACLHPERTASLSEKSVDQSGAGKTVSGNLSDQFSILYSDGWD